jgi:hypothetical protein
MLYLIQFIGVVLGLAGVIWKIQNILIIGGFICLGMDILGIISRQLKPTLPMVFYIIGFLVTGSWRGILYGSIILNTITFGGFLLIFIFILIKLIQK